ncbi:hypothetical protein D3C77_369790 [compost metagenome]
MGDVGQHLFHGLLCSRKASIHFLVFVKQLFYFAYNCLEIGIACKEQQSFGRLFLDNPAQLSGYFQQAGVAFFSRHVLP